jgi:hypothetical protein
MLEQCLHCPRRTGDREGPCIGQYMINDAYCVKAKAGDPRYLDAILGWEAGPAFVTPPAPPPQDPDEAARLRRAAKPRMPLGVKQSRG